LYADQGDVAGAFEDYDTAIRLNPSYAHAYRSRGILRNSEGDKAGARNDFDAALRLSPDLALHSIAAPCSNPAAFSRVTLGGR
jgi:tetratricopeptide (TPR) repeat protein